MTHPLIRRLAAVVALALLCLVPISISAETRTPTKLAGPGVIVCDDLFAWGSCGEAADRWWGNARGNDEVPSDATTDDVLAYLYLRAFNRGTSNPTQVPVVDDDLKFMIQPTLRQIGAFNAQRMTRGVGVTIAVLDGGFRLDHPALAGRLMGRGYDAIDHDFDAHEEGNGRDDDGDGIVDGALGHGTFVAGLILQVAPDAMILPIRTRDDEGFGTNDELLDALMHAWMEGVDIINVSASSLMGSSRAVRSMVEYLSRTGTLVISSAGNDGFDWTSELGAEGTSLVVGSVDAWNRMTPWSNRPSEPGSHFVLAPGEELFGPLGIDGRPDSYGTWSGTSFSTALVSGGAALIKATYPWLGSAEIMERLMHRSMPAYDMDGSILPYGRMHLGLAVSR